MKALLPLALVAAAAAAAFLVLFGGSTDPATPPVPPTTTTEPAAAVAAPTAAPAAETPEATPAPADGGVLVLDGESPTVDAEVYTGTPPFASFQAVRELGRTGADGRLAVADFKAEPGTHVFALTRRRVAPPVPWDGAGATLALGEGAVLTGRILDREGRPIRGAALASDRAELAVTTDEEGRYRLAGLAPVGKEEFAVAVLDGGREEHEIEFTAWDQVMERDFVLDGPPPGGILVEIRFGKAPTESTEFLFEMNGKGRPMELWPGPASLRLPRFPPGTEVRIRAASTGFALAEKAVKAPPVEERLRVVLEMRSGGRIPVGRVVDDEGRPVADVEVFALEEPSLEEVRSGPSVRTGADGTFRLRLDWHGRHFIAMRKGEATSDWGRLTRGGEDLVLVLGPGAVVEGRVLDQVTGTPVPGVIVELRLHEDQTRGEWQATSDETGAYRFAGVPVDAFAWPEAESSLRARAVVSRNAFREKSRTDLVKEGLAAVIEKPGQVFHRDLMVHRRAGGEVVLRVELPAEVATTAVVLKHTWTGADGWQESSSSVEPVNGVATLKRYLAEGTNTLEVRAGRFTGSTGTIEVTGDAEFGERTIELSAGRRVIAQLVNEAGEPVKRSGVRVQLAQHMKHPWGGSGGGSIGNEPTDLNGRADVTSIVPNRETIEKEGFTLAITLYGDGLLKASPFGDHANLKFSGAELLRLLEAGKEDLVLKVPAIESLPVTIRTVDPRGAPVAGVRVRLSDEFTVREATSGSDGRITVGARFDPEQWSFAEVTALPPHFGSLDSSDEGAEVTMIVQRLRQVRVRVLDDQGAPVPNAEIRVRSGMVGRHGPPKRPRTGADGLVDVSLPEGGAHVSIEAHGYWDGPPLVVPPQAAEAVARIYRVVPVRVRVTAPEALSLEDELTVQARLSFGEQEQRANVTVKRAGPGSFEGEFPLPPVPRRLSLVSPDERYEAKADVAADAHDVSLTLVPRTLHDVELLLIDTQDKPVADVEFQLRARHGGKFLPEKARSDADGRLHLKLPSGTTWIEQMWSEDGWYVSMTDLEVPSEAPIKVRLYRR